MALDRWMQECGSSIQLLPPQVILDIRYGNAIVLFLLTTLCLGQVIFQPQNEIDSVETVSSSPINIDRLFNNRGFGKAPRDANFDTFYSPSPLLLT